MTQRADSSLTPEERAQVMQIQDRLIDLFVDRGAAVDAGDRAHADALQNEIEDLMRERDSIKLWAGAAGK